MRPLNRRERWGASLARCLLTRHFWTFALLVALAIGGAPKLPLLICFMAAGTRELKSDGTLQLSADGKSRLANGSNDTCCCSCWTCTNCTDTAPAAYIVTLSGISFCHTSCDRCNADPGSHSRKQDAGSVDGTYTVPCVPASTCVWEDDFQDITFTEWSDPACGGAPQAFGFPQTVTFPLTVQVSKITEGGVKKFRVFAFEVAAWTFFDGKTSVDTCADSGGYSVSNANACTGCVGGGSGGTATITPA